MLLDTDKTAASDIVMSLAHDVCEMAETKNSFGTVMNVLRRAMRGATDAFEIEEHPTKAGALFPSADEKSPTILHINPAITGFEKSAFEEFMRRFHEKRNDTLALPVMGSDLDVILNYATVVRDLLGPVFGKESDDACDNFMKRLKEENFDCEPDTTSNDLTHTLVSRAMIGRAHIWHREYLDREHDPVSEKKKYREPTPETLRRLLLQNRLIAEKIRMNLLHVLRTGDRHFAEGIVREGYYTLRDIDEATDYEWFEAIKRRILFRLSTSCAIDARDVIQDSRRDGPKPISDFSRAIGEELLANNAQRTTDFADHFMTSAQHQAAREMDLLFDESVRDLHKKGLLDPERYLTSDREDYEKASTYLSTHEKVVPKKLRDVLQSNKRKTELQSALERGNFVEAGLIERGIVTDIFRQLMRYPDRRSEYSYIKGFPKQAVSSKELSCFIGTWTLAALCMECGMQYKQLYYCDVHEAGQGPEEKPIFGTHAALLITFSDGQNIFADPGNRRIGRQFSFEMIPLGPLRENARLFFDFCKNAHPDGDTFDAEPVHLHIPKQLADITRTYRDFTLMQLDRGFGAGHFLHTGISFLHEGKLEEAKLAFETGLSFNMQCPDLWCYLGIIALQQKNPDDGEKKLAMALDCNPNHLHSLYYLGVLSLQRNDKNWARAFFEYVGDDKRRVWGDIKFQAEAKMYVKQLQDYERLLTDNAKIVG